MCGQWMGWLARCARATGYPVTEVPGWRTRGHGPMSADVEGTVCHHTAMPASAYRHADFPSLNVVTRGRSDLPGPLCNFGLGRSGRIYVVAAGTAWHAGAGGWHGWHLNSQMVGIEAESCGTPPGVGDWTGAQLDCYPRLCASIQDWLNHEQPIRVCGHKEWAPRRKIDPTGIDMPSFRSHVGRLLAHGYRAGTTSKAGEDDDMDMNTEVPTPQEAKDGTVGQAMMNMLFGDAGQRRDGEIAHGIRHMQVMLRDLLGRQKANQAELITAIEDDPVPDLDPQKLIDAGLPQAVVTALLATLADAAQPATAG